MLNSLSDLGLQNAASQCLLCFQNKIIDFNIFGKLHGCYIMYFFFFFFFFQFSDAKFSNIFLLFTQKKKNLRVLYKWFQIMDSLKNCLALKVLV